MAESELIKAVRGGEFSATERLIRSGAPVDETDDNGWTALHWAAGKGKLEIARLLMSAGANPLSVGRDLRTPSMIALAAAHVEAAKMLEAAERDAGGPPAGPEREYCKAYYLNDLRQFQGWKENAEPTPSGKNGSSHTDATPEAPSPNVIVYLHQNYVVTQSGASGEKSIFDAVTDEWKHFCNIVLKFKVPDDLELIAPVQPSVACREA